MKREQRRAEARAKILSAAAMLVARSGPDRLSLREVARSCSYSPAGLYAYFDGREAILAALAERDAEALAQTLRATPAQTHPLIDLGLTWLHFAQAHPGRLPLALTAPGDTIRMVFIERVEACVATGEVMPGPDFDVEEIAATLQATVHGFATLGLSADLLREGLRCLLDGLRG